jgi:hypothetical protein
MVFKIQTDSVLWRMFRRIDPVAVEVKPLRYGIRVGCDFTSPATAFSAADQAI